MSIAILKIKHEGHKDPEPRKRLADAEMTEFIVLRVQSELDYIRKEAINALTCCCLRSIDMSR